jgi:short-subunit dehydrogenase
VLINNAGISMRALFKDSNFDVLEKLMNTNFWGTVYCSKFAIPYLIESKGSLVAISSIGGFLGIPGRAGYSSSKFAIHGLMETIRIENRKSGLHTMLMCPGFTASDIRVKALNANGDIQGESPRDESHMHTPEYVAKRLIKGIKHRNNEVIITMEGKLLSIFHRVIPRLVDLVAFRRFAKEPNSPFK